MGGDICSFTGPTYDYDIYIQTVPADLMDSFAALGAKPVAGLGARALWTDHALYMSKGNRAVEINFSLPHKVTRMTPAMTALAKAVARRM
jgi:hypothetical protein